MSVLNVESLDYSIGEKTIIKEINLKAKDGEFTGIIGPNGSGKSTFLKNVYKLLKPDKGLIYLDSKDLLKMTNRESAREISVVAQESYSGFDFSVMDIVLMGRNPYKSMFQNNSDEDIAIAQEALKRVGLEDFFHRSFLSLSGGEKQRALIARALAQKNDFLILDEPTNHLDIGYQVQIMNLIKGFHITTLAAIHDINLAALYCDNIYVIKDGEIIREGKPEDIITVELIKFLFNIDVEIYINSSTNKVQMDLVV